MAGVMALLCHCHALTCCVVLFPDSDDNDNDSGDERPAQRCSHLPSSCDNMLIRSMPDNLMQVSLQASQHSKQSGSLRPR